MHIFRVLSRTSVLESKADNIYTMNIFKKELSINKIFFIVISCFAFLLCGHRAEAGQKADTVKTPALGIKLKSYVKTPAGEICLGDICDFKTEPGFKIDLEKIKNIQLGFAPPPFVERRIYKFEVENAIRGKLEFPSGCGYSIGGADHCKVTSFAGGETDDKAKSILKKELENKICELFIKKYSGEFEIGAKDKITVSITGGLGREAVKKLTASAKAKIDIIDYKSSAANIAVSTENRAPLKLTAKITRKTPVAAASENLSKNTVIDMNKIMTREIEIFAEKYGELFLINDSIENDRELSKIAAEGLELIRNVRAGEILKKSFFNKKILVKAGQTIVLHLRNKRSSISFSATASKNAGEGDIIEAVNPRTRKKYKAVVSGEGTAEAVEN